MPIDVQMPDGTIITGVPDNVTQADLMARYQSYAATPQPPDMRKAEDVGFLEGAAGAAKRGVESFQDVTGGLSLAKAKVLGTEEEAASKMREIKREQAKPQETPGLTAADIERIYKEKGLAAAAGQVPSYITQQILQSAPQMAVPLAAGEAATALSAPVVGPYAPAVGLAVGIGTYGVQQFGNFLTRQAVEKNDVKELDVMKAATTAGATAPLGYFADKFTAGLTSLGTKKAGAEVMKELSARQIAARVGKRVGVGATEGIIAEAPLEVLEQAAERYQAGLSLTGDDATNEYKEAFFGAAGAGAGIGGASRGIQGYREAKAGQPPAQPTIEEPQPKAVQPAQPVQPIEPTAPAAPAGGQDIQAMIDELRGIPAAQPTAPAEVQPTAQPVQPTAQVQPPVTQAPIDAGYWIDKKGNTGKAAISPDGTKFVDAATGNPLRDVEISSNPPVQTKVWESIQNRDRSTPASVAQMAKIANAPDYSRVSMSRDYGSGAPIVAGQDVNQAQLGRTDTVTGADGKKVPVQYAVVEAGQVIPSHNADGTKNPAYVDSGIPALRAITNGRVAGLQAAYMQGTAQDYRASLLEDDLHGIDPKVIEGMQNPMLVRVMPMDQVNKNTGDISNTGAGLTFNAVEQAKNDTNRLDLSTVQFNDNGEVSPQTVRDFIKAMPTTEQGNLIDKQGNPTKQAIDRVDAAIFQQAYNNDKLTELAFQAQDEEARNIIRALNMAASKAIQLGEAGDYDVRPVVNEAVEMAINARRNGIKLSDLAKQGDMTTNPLTNDIVQMFADNPRSAKAIGENLSNLFTNAYQEGTKGSTDLLGAVPKRPVDQLIKESFAKKVEPDLFAQQPTEPAKAPVAEPSAGEPVANPESITKPDPKWNQVKTGQEITLPMYQGRGESAANIYNDVQVPVAGKGQYYAATGEDAAKYGEVKKYNVTLKNPLVIKTDDEWRDLAKRQAGWRFPNPFGLSEEETIKAAQALKDTVLDQGYDSLVIKPSNQGDEAKTLYNVFGHDQAVLYKEQKAVAPVEKPPVEVPVQAVQPEPKEFQIKKPLEIIAAEIGKMDKGTQVSKWLIENAPNSAAKAIAERISANIKSLEDAGVPVRVEVMNGSKRMPYYGLASYVANKGGDITHFSVKYNGLNSQGKAETFPPSKHPTGTRYSTIMHEMLHVLSMVQLDTLIKKNFKGPEKVIQNELRSIYRAVQLKVEEENSLPPGERHPAVKRSNLWLKNVDELWVRALTESDFQDFLSTINMGKKSALTKLMEVFRKVIGLNPEYQSALDKIMLVSDKIFAHAPEDIQRLAKHRGYKFITMKEEAVEPEASTKAEEPDFEGEARNYKGKPVKATWDLPEDTTSRVLAPFDQTIQGLIYKLQDKQIDTKDAQKAIEEKAGKIADEQDVYEQEQLYHGRTATGIREFLLDELMPSIKEMQKLKLTPQEVKDYLHNRHAEERNNKMNEVNKLDPVTGEERTEPWELQDRASGISTKDAREYLANLDPAKKAALEKVAARFDKMVKETQQILIDSGAESKDTVDAWNNTYEHYVPLFRIEDDFNKVSGGIGATGSSKGFGTRGGFTKRAMGSEKEVQDILGNLIAQRERALIRAEKIKVGKALYGLALLNPNPDVWLPVNPDAIKSKEALIKELEGLGFDDAEKIAENLMEEPKTRYISKEKKLVTDPVTGLPMMQTQESVKLKIDNLKRFGDNVFPIRIDGKDRYIFFNKNNPRAERMVHSLLNLDVDNLGFVTSNIAKLTRWFASVNTQYNPIFGAVNLIRDVGGANFNLTSTAIAGEQAKVSKGVIPAMRGILNVLRDERKGKTDTTGKWAKAFQEFRKEGGQTGYRDSLIRTQEEKQVIEREMSKMESGNAKKAFSYVMGALSDFNDMMENSVRVSAYVAARDKGLSPQKAAILAKNLTVNFDKKGQLSAAINSYYAFFNASVQGTARLAQTLKGPKGKAIMAGGIGLGAMQAVLLAAAGYDDDEPPEFVKERNFIIPLPEGKYITIPYPLGLHILPNVGRISSEFVLQGGKGAAKKIVNLAGAFADAFSPVGSSGFSAQSFAPTVADPFLALEANKDAFGRPIYKKDQATHPTPGYLRSRDSASEISKTIAYYLNLASGGTKYSKGFISPTADEIDYVAGQITGGVGREVMKLEQAIKSGITGEELPAYRIPLAGRFYGETQSAAAESQRFYNNIIKMSEHEDEIKGRIKNRESVGPYLKEHPEARMWERANTTENQINALNKQKKEFIERGLPKDRIKRIENQKTMIMKRFNDQVEKVEK